MYLRLRQIHRIGDAANAERTQIPANLERIVVVGLARQRIGAGTDAGIQSGQILCRRYGRIDARIAAELQLQLQEIQYAVRSGVLRKG